MSLPVRDIAWFAGLLEGEGCFFNIQRAYAPRISLGMTDRDVVEKAAALVGNPSVYRRVTQHPKHKDQWWFMLTGHRAVGVMFTIYPFMGVRRRAKIREVVSRWKQSPYRSKPHGTGVVTNCQHADRRHYAHGLCRPCYSGKQKLGVYEATA